MFSGRKHPDATGAGFLYPRMPAEQFDKELEKLRGDQGKDLDSEKSESYYAAVEFLAMQRITMLFVVRSIGYFLFAVALFNALAFFKADSIAEGVPCALSVVVNLVAAMHYRAIARIRMDSSMTRRLAAYCTDAVRYGEWLVTLPFLVRKIYYYINHEPFGAGRDFFLSVETAVITAVAMILLGALSRLATDEMWDWNWTCFGKGSDENETRRNLLCLGAGLVPFLGSMVCMIFLIVDMTNATYNMENRVLFRSFFFVWTVYPIVASLSILSRQPASWNGGKGAPVMGSFMIKDIAYGLADCWSKGAFGLYSAHAVFGLSMFGAEKAAPYVWPSPSPPM